MNKSLGSLLVIGGALLIAYLKLRPFNEKKCNEAEQSTLAEVLSKEVKQGTYNTGSSSGLGYSYTAKFRTDDGRELELFMYELEWGGLKEGMIGQLTYKGQYFIKFKELPEYAKKKEEVSEDVEVKEEDKDNYEIVKGLDKDEEREFMEDAGKVAEIGIVEDGLRVKKKEIEENIGEE